MRRLISAFTNKLYIESSPVTCHQVWRYWCHHLQIGKGGHEEAKGDLQTWKHHYLIPWLICLDRNKRKCAIFCKVCVYVCVMAIASDPDFQFGSKRLRQAVKGRLPVNLYLKIFDTQIRPIFEYASEIWCQDISIGELEQVLKIKLPENHPWLKLWNCGPD